MAQRSRSRRSQSLMRQSDGGCPLTFGSAAKALRAISVSPVSLRKVLAQSQSQCHRPGQKGFLSKTKTHHTWKKVPVISVPSHNPKERDITAPSYTGNHRQVLSYLTCYSITAAVTTSPVSFLRKAGNTQGVQS